MRLARPAPAEDRLVIRGLKQREERLSVDKRFQQPFLLVAVSSRRKSDQCGLNIR